MTDPPDDYVFDVVTAKHDDMKGGGGYPTIRSRVVISIADFPNFFTASEVAGCLAASVHGGMPIAILIRY